MKWYLPWQPLLVLALLAGMVIPAQAQSALQTRNVVLITLDGLRWQEVFGGAVDSLMEDKDYVRDVVDLRARFDGATREDRRQKLLPFFWDVVARKGQIYGNRWLGSRADATNGFWFSYPGYNEILTGFSDPRVNSNAKASNANVTVLEWLGHKDDLKGRIAAFCSWDVFPFIINEQRSGIPVNAGFEQAQGEDLSSMEQHLNILQSQVPSPWASVRLDAFTHHYALEYVKRKKPRVLYIAYGETDDFAHDGRYDHYLISARQTSDWLQELWTYFQADPFYAGTTTMLITTDHGRGTSPKSEWKGHGKTITGSHEIWMAVIGPDTPSLGEMSGGHVLQNQVARTLARFLGYDYLQDGRETGDAISTMFQSD